MSVSNHPKAYGTAAVTLAFITGIFLTLGFKDFYPDLERRYQRRHRNVDGSSSSMGENTRRLSTATYLRPVTLEDHEKEKRQSISHQPSPSIPEGIEGTIGNTPLIKIKSLSEATGCEIFAKCEYLNGAGGSPKDRVALNMILRAEEDDLLTPWQGDTIYEGTVGSTGISLAVIARARGYKCHICMPSDQSQEKVDLLHHLGATVERLTPAPITSTEHFVNVARRRAKEHTASQEDNSKGYFADQFENGANYTAHLQSTGPEIYDQMGGQIDAFVAGAGTGGTISGVALFLKREMGLKDTKIVLADPQGSSLYNKVKYGVMFSPTEKEGTRRRSQVDSIVEGVGINRLTENFDAGRELVEDAVRVTDEQAMRMARWLVERDGIFVGSSSAVNCVAAVRTAMGLGGGARVVTILCDGGNRHLSKFWKRVGEMGLEEEHGGMGLLDVLGIGEEK